MVLRQTLLVLFGLFLLVLAQDGSKNETTTVLPTTTVTFSPVLPTLQSIDDPSQGAGCLPRYHDCAIIGRADVCCELEQICVADGKNRAACCPYGAKCIDAEQSPANILRRSEGLLVAVGVGSIAWSWT